MGSSSQAEMPFSVRQAHFRAADSDMKGSRSGRGAATVSVVEDGPHLIVLRGNSATGKSTLAAALQRVLGPRTANIGQDHFRRVVLREHDVPDADNIGLIEHNVRYCAALGHHVILEGILFAKHYRPMLSRVIAGHHGPSHVFYVDVPLEETLRRHATRPLAADVPADKMRDWYVPGDTLGLPGETVLDGTADLDAMLDAIRARIGPVATAVTTGGDRFL